MLSGSLICFNFISFSFWEVADQAQTVCFCSSVIFSRQEMVNQSFYQLSLFVICLFPDVFGNPVHRSGLNGTDTHGNNDFSKVHETTVVLGITLAVVVAVMIFIAICLNIFGGFFKTDRRTIFRSHTQPYLYRPYNCLKKDDQVEETFL